MNSSNPAGQAARTARAKADDRFRGLLESAPDAMVIVSRAGLIEIVNVQTERLFGYSREELLGQKVEILLPQRYRQDHTGHRGQFFAGPKVRPMGAGLSLYGLRKDGTEFPVEVSLSPIQTEDGMLVSSAIRDVSERKKVENILARQRTELEKANAELKVANQELESFSYSVSHDLRAPLRAIDGYSLALLEDYGHQFDPQAHEYIDRVRAAAGRMADLIDDLLNLSRMSRTELSPELVSLTQLVKAIAADLQRTQPDRGAEFVIDEGLETCADAHLMRIALENLIGNAWKFTSKTERPRIEFRATTIDGISAYFVRDNGAGFDPAYADQLFRAFQRLHGANEFSGTGIGLATVKRIIHRHGGNVWAQSCVGRGATFYFTLSEPARAATPPPR
jgi:PAS domain S-box-containing protein